MSHRPIIQGFSQSLRTGVTFTLVLAAALWALLALSATEATVTTDKEDYYPGDTVVITGAGWEPGETVSLHIVSDCLCTDTTFATVADADGNIEDSSFLITEQHLGCSFLLTATGQSSGRIATHTFTDSPKVGSVTVGTQSPNPVVQGSSATYTVTVSRGSDHGSSGSFTADMSVTTTLPAGATASFSPNPVSFTPGDSSKTSTLTISTTGATPVGSHSFTVKAATSANDFATNTGTLSVISSDVTPPTTSASALGTAGNNGWYRSSVTVTLSATDNPGGSGVAATYYKIDGGAPVAYAEPFAISADGTRNVEYWSTDNAGNIEAAKLLTIKIDTVPPVITEGATSGTLGSAGWYRSDVSVAYTAADLTSGLADALDASFSLTTSGEGSSVSTGSRVVYDNAGNSSTAGPKTFMVDKTAPNIVQGATTGTAGNNGWYRSDVSVAFTASDSVSGLASSGDAGFSLNTSGEGESVSTDSRVVFDVAGNSTAVGPLTFKVDKTSPTISFGDKAPLPNAAGWNNSDVSIPFSASDAISGVASTSASSPLQYTVETAGEVRQVTVTDNAGNSAVFDAPEVKLDKTPPTLTLGPQTPAANAHGWNNTPVSVPYSASDDLSGLASPASGSLVFDSDGANQIQSVTVYDVAGNSAMKTTDPVNIDTIAPSLSFGALSPAPTSFGWNNTDVEVSFSVSDALSGADDGANPASPLIFTEEGDNQTQSVTVYDKAGNSTTGTSPVVRIDKTKPSLSWGALDPAPHMGWNNTAVHIPYTPADALSGVDPGTGAGTLTFSGEGTGQTQSVTIYDQAGNSETFTSPVVNIDLTPPTIEGTPDRPGDANPSWYKDPVLWTFTCADAGGSGVHASPLPILYSGPDGVGVFVEATCTDVAGNSTTTRFYFNYDATAPVITVSGASDGDYTAANLLIDASVSDLAPHILSAMLDGDPFTLGSWVTAEGNHELVVFAEDMAGNQSTQTIHFTIDRTAPEILFSPTSPADGGIYNATQTLTYHLQDNLDTSPNFTLQSLLSKLSGADHTGFISSPHDVTAEGRHTVTLEAVDRALNFARVSRGFLIDYTAPVSTFAVSGTLGDNGWYVGSPVVTINCSDPDVRPETDPLGRVAGSGLDKLVYSVNGGPWQYDDDGSVVIPITTEGVHTVEFYGTDVAGNEEGLREVVVHYDETAPTTSASLSTPPNGAGWHNTDVTLNLDAADQLGLSGVREIRYRINGDPEVVVAGDEASILFETDGIYSVTYYAVDGAGNVESEGTQVVKLDKTKPTLSFGALSPAPNAAGWNKSAVDVPFTPSDNLSGVASTDPDDTALHFTSETDFDGETKTVTVTDVAGNSDTFTSPVVKIDMTAPVITLDPQSPAQNANGWNNTDVTIAYSIADALSGVDGDEAGTLSFTGEGAGQTQTVNAVDVAGNTASATSPEVNIDKTAPTLTFGSQAPPANAHGWNNTDVSFGFTTADNLSGVDLGSLPANPVVLSSEGSAVSDSVTVTDLAGNSASFDTPAVKIDKTDPMLSFDPQSPPKNGNGWNNTDVTIVFSASDGLSGVESTSPASSPLTFSAEGENQTQTVTVTDYAGNSKVFTSPSVSIDKTAPTLSWGDVTPAPNAAGWNKTNVTIGYTTGDALSGVDSAAPGSPLSFTSETSGESRHVIVTDKAGNSAGFNSPMVKIDKTPPVITVPGPIFATSTSALGAAVVYTVGFSDALSGLKPTSSSNPPSGSTFPPGTTIVHCMAEDFAGNLSQNSFTVTVNFAWSNLLPPINVDGTSIFKLGSTIPVKFRLTGDSAGITNLVARLYVAKISNGIAGSEFEAVSTSAADTGNTFRYSDGQYIFNLSTKPANGFSEGTWLLRVDMGDGVARVVQISIKK